MQQVHGGRYDFTRFTHLGQRHLFREFAEIDSGVVGGPAIALVWSLQYFLLSFVRHRASRAAIKVFARLAFAPWKNLDRLLNRRPGAIDAASGLYFLGRRAEQQLADRTLIAGYRGAM